ncbi:MAG: metal ABC transporter permease [Candidatus Liberibacter ctenarytainae]|uniref:Metal ABC transporter permease n=1 Tax=Candidatus Liberibacter ctenarytainae TaxID=2020335 RepID=A0A937AJH6_9HYPH|nr:metal ABC transporter permease [Candidatus Liberibacter ctenarytainae]
MSNLMHYVLYPLQFPAILNSLLIATIVVVPMAILSCFVILKNQSFLGEVISHSSLPGIVLAYMVGIPLEIGAFFAAMVCTLSSGYLKEKSNFSEDILLNIVFSSMFALGIIMMLKFPSNIHFNHILLGDMLGIDESSIVITGLVSLMVISFLILKKKDLLLLIFDPMHARSVQIPTRLLHYSFLIIIAVIIVLSLKSTGIILPPAALVFPGSTAFLLSRHHTTMILISVIISIICTILGVYISFFINSSASPTIVMLMSFSFLITYLYSGRTQKS